MKDGNEKKARESKYNYHFKTRLSELVFQGKNYQLDHAYIRKCKIKQINGKYDKIDFKLKVHNLPIEPSND